MALEESEGNKSFKNCIEGLKIRSCELRGTRKGKCKIYDDVDIPYNTMLDKLVNHEGDDHLKKQILELLSVSL